MATPRVIGSLALALVLILAPGVPAAQERLLADPEAFYAAVRANLARSEREQFRYAYTERRAEVHRNPFGRLGTGAMLTFEVTPVAEGTAVTRRLIARDGKPVADVPIERRERRPRANRAEPAFLNDVIQTLEFTPLRRERSSIVVAFAPRANATPQTRQGRMARAFKGEVWIDEERHEVERVEAIAIDNLSFGFGLIARINEGTKAFVRREPVGEGLWLPTSVRFKGEGRAAVFRKLTLDFTIEWLDYKRLIN